jgi:hypothetical protein
MKNPEESMRIIAVAAVCRCHRMIVTRAGVGEMAADMP